MAKSLHRGRQCQPRASWVRKCVCVQGPPYPGRQPG